MEQHSYASSRGERIAQAAPEDSGVALLARKQTEFETLLRIQSERRQKEDEFRRDEQRFEMREESLIREAHSLAQMKASFHAEKISWKRAMEDDLRREEDARRAVEDARRAEEDERRRKEEAIQIDLDDTVQHCYEQLSIVQQMEKNRLRRWIEEDRVRALEDILISQDVLDLELHSRLRQHVHNHFDILIGYGAPSNLDVDTQIDALLDALLTPLQLHSEQSAVLSDEESHKRSHVQVEQRNGNSNISSGEGTDVIIESSASTPQPSFPEGPPSYQAVMNPPLHPDQIQSSQSSSSAVLSTIVPLPLLSSGSRSPSDNSNQAHQPKLLLTSISPLSTTTLLTPNIEVDDFAVLEDEDIPSVTNQRVPLSSNSPLIQDPAFDKPHLVSPNRIISPSSSSSHLIVVPPALKASKGEEDALANSMGFDLSIEPTKPLVINEDWEFISGRLTKEATKDFEGNYTQQSGVEKRHTVEYIALREDHMQIASQQHAKQFTKIMSDSALTALLDPNVKLSDFNPFSKLVLSTRDTWDSCDQCGTYFDRMSIKQTCGTCAKHICSKCGLTIHNLDLSILTSKIPETSHLRMSIPKTKEDFFVEVKCCTACVKTLTMLEAKETRGPSSRANFFSHLYDKSLKAKQLVQTSLVNLDEAIQNSKDSQELDTLEAQLLSALRKFQSIIDSYEQTINTLKNELPVNPNTGLKYTSSAEIRTLSSIKSALGTFLLENKQLSSHYKLLRQSRIGASSSSAPKRSSSS